MIPLTLLQLFHPAINQLEKHCVYRYINIINIYIYIFESLYFSDYIFSLLSKNTVPPSVFIILSPTVVLKRYGSF